MGCLWCLQVCIRRHLTSCSSMYGIPVPSSARSGFTQPSFTAASHICIFDALTTAICPVPLSRAVHCNWQVAPNLLPLTASLHGAWLLCRYGVANDTFGLINAPCKACSKNLHSPPGSTSYTACKNKAGFGYTSEGANQCPGESLGLFVASEGFEY